MLKQIGINVCCGRFSYSEIPSNYSLTIGVSGTLDSMSETQKKITSERYSLTKYTKVPSCYGENKLKSKEIIIMRSEDFNMALA